MTISRRTTAAAIAGATAFAFLATGCSGPAAPATGDDWKNEKITLKVATFNDFGYTDEFLAGFTKEYPNITVEHTIAATSNDARTNYFTKLGAGSGLADVEAVEVDWLPEIMTYSDKLTDLTSDDTADRWISWKSEAATDPDGRLIGYGTDIGPEAVCYRSDLFADAGLPTDREEVATLLEGDWQHYFDIGEDFVSKSDAAWFDSAGATYQGMVNQITNAYEEEDGTIIAGENPVVSAAYNDILDQSGDLSAHLTQWSEDWYAAFSNGAYATMLCPSWMLGIIEGEAPDVKTWDVADVYPNGGGNWGGSYLTVPAQGANAEAAKEFAAWLTAPEQQLKAFVKTGNFPSQIALQDAPELLEVTRPFFNDAPVGELMAGRAAAVPADAPFKGIKYFPVMKALQDSLTRVDVDKTQNASDSWAQFLKDLDALK